MIKKTTDGTFRVRISSGGRTIASRNFKFKKDAEKWETEQKRQLAAGEWFDERRGKIRLDAVIILFNDHRRGLVSEHAWATDEANLRLHLPKGLRGRAMGSITTSDITGVLSGLVKTKAQSTVKRIRDSFVALWEYADGQGYVPRNVVLKASIARGTGSTSTEKVRPLDSFELTEILDTVRVDHTEYSLMMEFIALTGLRWGEARELRVGDLVQRPAPLIRVSRSRSEGYKVKAPKNGRSRRVPMEDRAEEIALGQSIGKRSGDLLFTAPRGGQVNNGNMKTAIKWSAICQGHRIYDLRHTAATRWLADGVPLLTVSGWLGHADSGVTAKRYAGQLEENSLAGLDILRAAAARRASSENSNDRTTTDSAPAHSTHGE